MKQTLKGYHYTSKENWEKIQKDGKMKPQKVEDESVTRYFPSGVNGVWLWDHNPKGESHAGTILGVVGRRGTTEVVKLEVDYKQEDKLTYGIQQIKLDHIGNIGNWQYHRGGDSAVIIKKEIPVQNIRQVGYYNTVQMLQ